jgi:hypothetical protein
MSRRESTRGKVGVTRIECSRTQWQKHCEVFKNINGVGACEVASSAGKKHGEDGEQLHFSRDPFCGIVVRVNMLPLPIHRVCHGPDAFASATAEQRRNEILPQQIQSEKWQRRPTANEQQHASRHRGRVQQFEGDHQQTDHDHCDRDDKKQDLPHILGGLKHRHRRPPNPELPLRTDWTKAAPANGNQYYMIGSIEHELTEIMGRFARDGTTFLNSPPLYTIMETPAS